MIIHKEGQRIIIISISIYLIFWFTILGFKACSSYWLYGWGFIGIVLLLFLSFFFRNPNRKIVADNCVVFSPADGEIVAIETVLENEYFSQNCIKISIFMSVFNMHVNRYPVSGIIRYSKYHPGRFFIACYPKASEFNEHHSTVIENPKGIFIMVKQIAGLVARRVVCYAKEGEQAIQGEDLGFIKFGSRVDLFLPLNTEVLVKLNEKAIGNRTIVARFNVK